MYIYMITFETGCLHYTYMHIHRPRRAHRGRAPALRLPSNPE